MKLPVGLHTLLLFLSLFVFACSNDDPGGDMEEEEMEEMEDMEDMEEDDDDEVQDPDPDPDPDPCAARGTLEGKINGVSFVSPSSPFPGEYMQEVDNVDAGWVALSPFAFWTPGEAEIRHNLDSQWWGEKIDGIIEIASFARDANLRIMMKPQVWSWGGWVGDFDLATEEEWKIWEDSYYEYVMSFAEISDSIGVEIFCVGTEYRKAAVQRPDFWRNLICDVKAVFSGPITYAANWDNIDNIPFWEDVDYLGVDSYFPLVNAKTPQVGELVGAWQTGPLIQLRNLHETYDKPILFTEYGYQSSDYSGWQNWENEANLNNLDLNMQAQSNCFEAMFIVLWQEDWFAGGFIWKWFDNYQSAGGESNKRYTPQRKPVEEIIREYY